MSTNDPKKQHFVPHVYLKHFCNAAGVLQVYHKIERKCLANVDPSNVAFCKHLYTVSAPDGGRDFHVETDFHEHESKYDRILQKIQLGRAADLGEQDIEHLLMFLALLNARNPRTIDHLKYVGAFLGAHPFNPDFTKLSEPKYLQATTMEAMRLWAEKIIGMMRSTGWVIYASEPGQKFITTDNPMADLSHIPLSSNLLFAFQSTRKNGMLPASPELVAEMNYRIVLTANRFIYAADLETLEETCHYI